MSKTKEMTIDFRSLPSAIPHVSIDNQVVENVAENKYIGIDENFYVCKKI